MGCEWREIPEFETYEVSNVGAIRRKENQRPRKSHRHKKKGYFGICLQKNGESIFRNVHCLVAAAFIGPRPPKSEVCHLNGNPSDNRVGNLRYGTSSENCLMKHEHGRMSHAKLTKQDVQTIRNIWVKGSPHTGTMALGRRYGVDQSTMHEVVTRKTWKHVV